MRVKEAVDKINKVNKVIIKLQALENMPEEVEMAAELLEDYKQMIRNLSLNIDDSYDWISAEYELPVKEETYIVWLEGDVVDVAVWTKIGGFCPWYAYYFEECPPEWDKKVLAWMPVKPYKGE